MSIYKVLSLDTPIIGYSIFHQAKKGTSTKEYLKTLTGLHCSIEEESKKIQERWNTFLNELQEKAIQITQGSLSQFLTTPLQTDMQEIKRIIRDQLQQLARQVLEPIVYGVVNSVEHRVLFDTHTNILLKKLLSEGKKDLRKKGFNVTETGTNIYESIYFVKGGQNLDLLEHIIRDRIGTYSGFHGQHVQQFRAGAFSVANLIMIEGELQYKGSKYEISFCFTKCKVTYIELFKILKEAFTKLQADRRTINISLWQRKLGLGTSPEFTLRLWSKDKNLLKDKLISLLNNLYPNKASLVLQPESLLVKELISDF